MAWGAHSLRIVMFPLVRGENSLILYCFVLLGGQIHGTIKKFRMPQDANSLSIIMLRMAWGANSLSIIVFRLAWGTNSLRILIFRVAWGANSL